MNKKEILKWYAKEFEKISKLIHKKDCISYYEFLRIRNFKLQNSSREDGDTIEKITNEAFKFAKKDEIEKAISKLLEIHGVAIPIASTILAMKYPNKYCIIDRLVLTRLGKEDWLKKYISDVKIYKEYLLLMRRMAKEKNINLREFERGLFEGNSVVKGAG